MASKVKVANYRHVEARYYCIGMLSSSPLPVAPAAVELMPPGGVRPFFPPVPPPLLQYQGNVFPGFQPNFPMIPPSPVPPLMPPPFWGPMMNHHTMTPQFPPSSVWGRPQTNNNKRFRKQVTTGAKSQAGSGPKPVLFVCTPCQKEYKSQETYSTHLATHVKCSQCEFECSKGAMHDHELIHYLPAELNFSSQEEIEKWREERRKNFPTAQTVQRKQRLQEQRRQAGNVADTPLYRYVSRVCGSDGGFSRQRGGKRNRWVVAGSNRKCPPRGRGGSTGGEVGGGERETETSSRPPWKMGHRGRGRGRGGRRGRGRYSESRKDCRGLNSVTAKKPSLLEKLLANEILIEQNSLLQCIRHVVKNDFLQSVAVREGGARGASYECMLDMKEGQKHSH